MVAVLKRLYHRHFTNPEAVILVLFLVLGFALLLVFGKMLAAVLAALVIAFVLEWVIKRLEASHVPRPWAIGLVYLGFLAVLFFIVLELIPMLSQQIFHLIEELPNMLTNWQTQLSLLPTYYPEFVTHEQMNHFIAATGTQVSQWGQQHVLAYSSAFVPVIAAMVVYLFLVPLMVFFMLKDKNKISTWFSHFLPRESGLVKRVWFEVYMQLGNYIRGKVAEILIVAVSSWILFIIMGLNYALLMAVIVGLSVLVPYVGITLVSIPLAVIAYFQWGWSAHFLYFMIAYTVLQVLDGNVLVPILFAEVVNIHPLAIIIAIIFFGALWGFWGVFFAIPLGILIKAVINAWPEPTEEDF